MRAALPLPPAALQTLREDYRQRKAALLAAMGMAGASTRNPRPALARLTRLADGTLRALWRACGLGAHGALVAVGGYGRGELFPYSDVDVLLLLPDAMMGDGHAPQAACQQALEAFITHGWDVGLEIGSSVRTVNECLQAAAQDITICTTLVEARLVAGSRALFTQFGQRFAAQLDPLDFLVAKQLEMRQRHAKFEDTPYALEPNCKESPGGLRDLQIILWAARAAGLGTSWRELGRRGLATPREALQLARNERLLGLIRTRLHLLAQRRQDRLVFDLQTAVAESLGLHDTRTPDGRLAERASERLMRKYYWCAKAVTQLNQIMLEMIEERLRRARASAPAARRIDAEFLDKSGLLEIADDALYRREPRAILRTFLVFEREQPGIRQLSARTLRALYNARALMDGRFRADPANRAVFLQILQQPQGIVHALRLMNQTSVLGRYLWAFRRIVGQMQHDLFHVYTVDQHILTVLRNVRRFFMPEHAHEYPYCAQLAASWDQPWLLYLAALFHDIAKGRGGDHCELGALQARRFCRQHVIAGQDAALIEFLVREHLTMSRVAQKEDLADPAVIRRFARRVGSERRLTALYLLTVADIRGTGPKVWNAWKGKLLEDLYRLALHALGAQAPSAGALIGERQRAALAEMARLPEELPLPLAGEGWGEGRPQAGERNIGFAPCTPSPYPLPQGGEGKTQLPENALQLLWDTLDPGYFMRHDADELAWHARHLAPLFRQPAGELPTVVRARLSPVGEGLQVMVYTADQPDLFAHICGYFDRAGFSILDARIHTARNGYALDTFQIVTGREAERHREFIDQVQAGLPLLLASSQPLPPPRLGRVSRRVKSFPIPARVDLQPDEKAQRWLLSISASDRAGLLYGIARVLSRHHISVELAKISTLGERVEDTFLLQGEQLQDQKTQIAIERELLEGLQSP
ncbi:MAG: [protein-PII] uridylyltransferase [Burkholderiaceae bacterium]|nr:[protein-PII] uridylyltransferase [Burkholderiaceae bacterium]